MVTKVLDAIDWLIRKVISLLLLEMTVVIFYQVVLRYLFKGSTIWAEELARYSFIWVVMLASAIAVRRYKHIRIDFLIDRMGPKLRYWVELTTYLVMVGMLALLTYFGASIAMQTMGQLSAGLHLSKGFMYMSIPIGSVLMIAFVLEILYKDFILRKGAAQKAQGN